MENQAEIDYAREERIRGAAMEMYQLLRALCPTDGELGPQKERPYWVRAWALIERVEGGQ